MARDVATCVELMECWCRASRFPRLALDEITVATSWTDQADPLVRARVEEAAALFPNRRPMDFPEAYDATPIFMREVADVHRDLYAEYAELYGDNIRPKIERCLEVDRRGVRGRQHRAGPATSSSRSMLSATRICY